MAVPGIVYSPMEEIMPTERKHYSPEEKVAILRKHLLEQVPVSELCDQCKLHPTLFYRWQKQFFENGAAAFSAVPPKAANTRAEQRITALEERLQRKHEVLSELMEEHVRLKKELIGES